MNRKYIRFMMAYFIISTVFLNGCSKNNMDTSLENVGTLAQMPANIGTEILTKKPAKAEKKTEIYVFIATSLSNVMKEIQSKYKEISPNVTIIFNSDSSGTLQTQIEEGATCDIFFSAAMKQMNYLDSKGYIHIDSIIRLLENKVVLIKPRGVETKVTGFDNIYEAESIALAGESVPVGAYAFEIFTNLGILNRIYDMEINEGTNVSTVLAAVSEKSNEVGVVYATDANSLKDSVEVIADAPEGSLQNPVIYPVALVKNPESNQVEFEAAKEFLAYLTTDEILSIFKKYGFSIYTE